MTNLTNRSYEFESFRPRMLAEGVAGSLGLRYSFDSRRVTPAPEVPAGSSSARLESNSAPLESIPARLGSSLGNLGNSSSRLLIGSEKVGSSSGQPGSSSARLLNNSENVGISSAQIVSSTARLARSSTHLGSGSENLVSSSAATQPHAGKEGGDSEKRDEQHAVVRAGFFVPQLEAECPMPPSFCCRVPHPQPIHSFRNPKLLPVARNIVPDDPWSEENRLLPSVNRDKMTKLPSRFGRSKRIMVPEQKPAGVFYTDGEVENSKNDARYWGSLASLWGSHFSRRRNLTSTQPTAMTVHYFNGGAPASPTRSNRRTCMAHLRGDSRGADLSWNLYGKDK